jgi:hypothetical protein
MSSPDEQSSYMEPLFPIGRTHLGLAALFVTPSPKKMDGKANRAVDEEPYINERKPSSTTAAKGDECHFLGNQNGIAGVHDFIFIIVIF